MPHIHNEPGAHDVTASGFIIRENADDAPELLLHQHKKLDMLLQVGGHKEIRENIWDTVLREVKEEAGYVPEQLQVLQPIQRITSIGHIAILHPQPFSVNTHQFSGLDHWHTDFAFGFIVSDAPLRRIDPSESQYFDWVSQSRLNALGGDRLPTNVLAMANFVFNCCLPDWDRVPARNYKTSITDN